MKALFLTLALLISSSAFARTILVGNNSQTSILMELKFEDGIQEVQLSPNQFQRINIPDSANRTQLGFLSFVDGQFFAQGFGTYNFKDLGDRDAAIDIYLKNKQVFFIIRAQ